MATWSSARSGRGRSLRRGESRRPGQWKLAYADFLTALMALFLLMWLSTEQSVANRQGIATYFSGRTISDSDRLSHVAPFADLTDEIATLPFLADHRYQVIATQTADSLRIELTDASVSPIFELGGAHFSELGVKLLSTVADLLAGRPFLLSIEGHTDAFPSRIEGFSNWDLSAERANAARRALTQAGVDVAQIRAVIGRADTAPLLPNQPHAPSNRRISIVLEQDS